MRSPLPRRPRIAIAFAVIWVAIFAPVLASVYLAWTQSVSTESSLNLAYSNAVLRRLDEGTDQFAAGKQKMLAANFLPCSSADIAFMRQIDLSSSLFKAAGRVENDTLICTSYGVTTPVPLGKPMLISERGTREYFGKLLTPGQWRPLNVFSSGGFAVIVDPDLATDISTEGPGIELAVFAPSSSSHEPSSTVGRYFPSNWFQQVPKGGSVTAIENGYLVTCARSAKWDIAVITATPVHYIYRRVSHVVFIFAPIGILCGILLAWAVRYITQLHTSFPSMLRRAIRQKEFYVEYQPIVELDSRRIIGAEALIRWKSPLANIPPDHFIPLAEDRGLIHLITDQVLAAVTRDLPRLLAIDPDFEVAINMSAGDLRSGRTLQQLDQLLSATGALPHNISVEATERAFLHDGDTAQLIANLRSMGFRVSIDDFGTGYSSLACLQSLSLDTLKIDKAFVETIHTNGATSQVVLHIIEMARSLHLQTIAEGVETEAQAQFLRMRGVRYAQGWLFGKSMPIATLLKKIPASTIDSVAVHA